MSERSKTTKTKNAGSRSARVAKSTGPARAPTLMVGIDLGTSRTAISSSNGHRLTLSTYVGKPRDTVSEKLLGKRMLFGEEAQQNRMSVELIRPLEKGIIDTSPGKKKANVGATRALLRHIVSQVAPGPDSVIHGVIGMPGRASIENKKVLIDAVRDILDAVIIVSEPFCVAYGLDILTDALILDIGAGTMDLCRMHGALPTEEDQVTIEKAGDFIDRTLYALIKKRHPKAQFSLNMIKLIKETYGYVSDKEEQIEVEFTVDGRPQMFDITRELKEASLTILPDLTEAIYQLIGSFDPEFQKRLRDNVVVCGGGCQMVGLRTLIEHALDELGGGAVTIIDEPVFSGANGALKIAHEMPSSFWEVLKN